MRLGLSLVAVSVRLQPCLLVCLLLCACAAQETPVAAPAARATSPFRAGDFVVYDVERAGEPLHVTIRLEVVEASPDRTLIKATSEKNGLPRTMTFVLGENQTALEAMERTAAEAGEGSAWATLPDVQTPSATVKHTKQCELKFAGTSFQCDCERAEVVRKGQGAEREMARCRGFAWGLARARLRDPWTDTEHAVVRVTSYGATSATNQ
jgi:hypothetical protein